MDKEPTLAEVAAQLKSMMENHGVVEDACRGEPYEAEVMAGVKQAIACLTVAHRVVAQAAAEEARNVAAGDMAGGVL